MFHQTRVKLTNFGLLNHLTVTSSTVDDFSIKSIPYVEPKLLQEQSYKKDARSDIYSFGVILWEISSGKPPYDSNNNDLNRNDLIALISENKREKIVTNTPKTYSNLYSQCWSNDPDKRPVIGNILNQLNDSMKAGS